MTIGIAHLSPVLSIIFGVLILIVVAGYGRDRRLRDTI